MFNLLLMLASECAVCLIKLDIPERIVIGTALFFLYSTTEQATELAANIRKFLPDIALWTRLTYISIHLQNEKDDLKPAKERLEDDLIYEGKLLPKELRSPKTSINIKSESMIMTLFKMIAFIMAIASVTVMVVMIARALSPPPN